MSIEREKYITAEAAKELEKAGEQIRRVVLAHATLLADEEGTTLINETHIKKAFKKVRRESKEKGIVKWFLRITLALLLPLAFFQISQIADSSQLSLWLLPCAVIFWIIIFSYLFRDYLL